jgi:hypothetical protein
VIRWIICLPAFVLVIWANNVGAAPVWKNDVPISKTTGDQGLHLAVVADGGGGAIIVWHDRPSSQIFTQRIDGAGRRLWGSPRAVAGTKWEKFLPSAIEDGAGGAIVAWIEGRKGFCTAGFWGECDVYAQRMNAAGLPLWSVNGMPVTVAERNQGASGLALAGDGKGGVFAAWEDARPPNCCKVFAQHLGSGGKRRWAAHGIQVSPEPAIMIGPMDAGPRIASDGKNGAIIAWINNQVDPVLAKPTINVQRVNEEGQFLWADGGVPVGFPSHVYFSMVGDGYGGAFLAFTVLGNDGFAKVAVQRVNGAGEPLWGGNGVVAGAADYYQEVPDIIADGAGGAMVLWVDHRNYDLATFDNTDIYAQRFSAEGSPLWTGDGLPICVLPGMQDNPRLVADGIGGAIMVWKDCRDYLDRDACFAGADIYAQHVTAQGKFLWRLNGAPVARATGTQGVPYGMPPRNSIQIATDFSGGGILAWPDGRNGFCSNAVFTTECDVYAQRILDQLPNLKPYQPSGWSDSLVVSNKTGTTVDDFPLYSTDLLHLDWAVINNGYKAIEKEFCTGLFLDEVLLKTWCLSSLGTGKSTSVLDYPLGSLGVGTHRLKIVIDQGKALHESSESDNARTKTIMILAK